MAFMSVTVTCIALCKKYRKWIFSQGKPTLIYQPTRFRLVFSYTLRKFSVLSWGKEQSMKNRDASNLFNNNSYIIMILKL